jgi:hypothetical protein
LSRNTCQALEQAFARIACRCGLSYSFESEADGWKLVLTDVERPDRSPLPIRSKYKKPRDAQHDLMVQAVDGRLRGHIAIDAELLKSTRVMRNGSGSQIHVGAR